MTDRKQDLIEALNRIAGPIREAEELLKRLEHQRHDMLHDLAAEAGWKKGAIIYSATKQQRGVVSSVSLDDGYRGGTPDHIWMRRFNDDGSLSKREYRAYWGHDWALTGETFATDPVES